MSTNILRIDARHRDQYNELCGVLATRLRQPTEPTEVVVTGNFLSYKRSLFHQNESVSILTADEADIKYGDGSPRIELRFDYARAIKESLELKRHLIATLYNQFSPMSPVKEFLLYRPPFYMDDLYPGQTGWHVNRMQEEKMPYTDGSVVICPWELFDQDHIGRLATYCRHNLITLRPIQESLLSNTSNSEEDFKKLIDIIGIAGCILCTNGVAEIFAAMFNIPTCVYTADKYRVPFKLPNMVYDSVATLRMITGKHLHDQSTTLLGTYDAFNRHWSSNQRLYENTDWNES